MKICWSNIVFQFQPWRPECGRVSDGLLSFDCETTLIDSVRHWVTPEYVIGAAFDGQRGWFVTREYLFDFLRNHENLGFIFHNAAFDLDVIQTLIDSQGHAFDIYSHVEKNCVADTMLLHQLYTLASDGHPAVGQGQATLESCALKYLDVTLPKTAKDRDGDDIRLSYGKWMNRITDIDDAYLEYLAKDCLATKFVFNEVQQRIISLLSVSNDSFGYVDNQWLWHQFNGYGPLTHHIQLKASIVLRAITAAGLYLDSDRTNELSCEINAKLEELKSELRVYGFIPGEAGNAKALEHILCQIERRNATVVFPRTPTNKISTKAEDLEQFQDCDPFLSGLTQEWWAP